MSIKVMSAVWERDDLDPHETLVLLALADHANDEGVCYPSIGRLVKRTRMSERGVQTVISRLCERGFLSIEKNAGPRGTNLYTVSATPAPDAPRTECTPAGDAPNPRTECAPTPAPGAPEPSVTINEPSVVPPVSPKPKPRRAVALPEGWVPSQKNIADAKDKNLTDQEIADEADSFRDHHLAKGTTFKDWDAGWRTWVRNSIKFRGRGMALKAHPSGYGQGGGIAGVVARRQFGGPV